MGSPNKDCIRKKRKKQKGKTKMLKGQTSNAIQIATTALQCSNNMKMKRTPCCSRRGSSSKDRKLSPGWLSFTQSIPRARDPCSTTVTTSSSIATTSIATTTTGSSVAATATRSSVATTAAAIVIRATTTSTE